MKRSVDRLVALKYADSVIGEDLVFRGGSKEREIPISFVIYLLQAGDRNILVDAGCEYMPGFVMRDFISPVEALAKAGLRPEEITDVIITHAHHDHMEALHRFPGAVVHIQQDECENGRRFIPEGMQVRTFEQSAVVADAAEAVRIAGHSIGSCVVEFEMDGEKCVICGDECYSSDCFTRNIPTGASCCPEKSQAFLDTYGKGYRRFLCHDPI